MHEGATRHYHLQAYLLPGAGTSGARGNLPLSVRHPAPALLHLRPVVTKSCTGGRLQHSLRLRLEMQCSAVQYSKV